MTTTMTQAAGSSEAGDRRDRTDRQLLDRFVTHGDQAAFAELVARHGPCVWAVCRRVLGQDQDAEDAFQAVFLILGRRAGTIRNRESVGSWLHGVAFRTAMKVRRAAGRRQLREKRASSAPAERPPPEQAAARELQRARGFYNAHIPVNRLRQLCELDAAGERTLEMAVRRMNFSARAHDRILKVARTIADLDRSAQVSTKHLAEAVQYRSLDRNYWQ